MSNEPTESSSGYDSITVVSIEKELRTSYLNYSMSVIVSRALPDVRDGLKPVQRRILTAMRDLNLNPSSKTRKCAKVVGDTMGNYHPHGDSAIYDALVRMGQDFNLRYPLILGQGNFGSISGDPAAAERYTECRMEKISAEILEDLDKDTVDFVPNYDGERTEPTVLPGKAPTLLLNGASGIAVGMATNIPPHNLTEICNGVIALLDNPEIDLRGLMEHVKGPDFPTGGYICGREGLYNAFATGRGSITMRAKCHTETAKNGRQTIIITEIPYQLNLETLEKKIAQVVKEGRVNGVSGMSNFSNKNGIRIAVELKMGEDSDVVLNQLYQLTPLQSRFSVNTIALVKGRPETLSLKQMLECFRDHRFEVIRRRTLFLLRKAEARAHILEGLLVALDNIDEVIKIIRQSPDVPVARAGLMERFTLTQVQAQAILDMRLARLTGLQRAELEKEYTELQENIKHYRAILADANMVYDLIREDCYMLIDKYGDDRRCEIIAAAEDITNEDLIAEEEMAVVVSHAGYIKRMALDVYRSQGRGGKGVTGMATKDGDFTEHLFIGSTHDYMLFFTNKGQVHWLKIYDVPQMGRAARGRSMANVLQLREGERVSSMVPVRTFDEEHFLVMATRRGVIKKTALHAFRRPMKGGIRAIKLADEDELIGVTITTGENELMLASHKGQACHFKEGDVRAMGRNAAGVCGMKLSAGDYCVGLLKETENTTVLTVSENGLGKRSVFADYRLTRRGARGVVNMKVTEKTGAVVACMAIHEDDGVMLMSSQSMVVRTGVASIRVIGRATQGVRMIRLKEGDHVVAVARIVGGGKVSETENADDENAENADADAPNAEPTDPANPATDAADSEMDKPNDAAE